MDRAWILADTSVWIEALRPSGSKSIKNQMEVLLSEDRVAISSIIMLELLSGTRTEREYHQLQEDLKSLHYIAITEDVWSFSYRLSRDARGAGLKIPSTDILIASIALISGCKLMHKDKHFSLLAKHIKLKDVEV